MPEPTFAPQLPPPTIVNGGLFFRQRGGDQLNGRRGTTDTSPVIITAFHCRIVVHRRLGTDQWGVHH